MRSLNKLPLQQLCCQHYSHGEGQLEPSQQQHYLQAIDDAWQIVLRETKQSTKQHSQQYSQQHPQQQVLQRQFGFNSYQDTLRFVNQVADLAEQQNHHPDILIQWRKCHIDFTTHSSNGITLNDFICASHVDGLYEKMPQK